MKRLAAIGLYFFAEILPIGASVAAGIFGTLFGVNPSAGWLTATIVAGALAILSPMIGRWDRYKRFIKWTSSSGRRAEALKHVLETMLQRALTELERNTNQFRASLYYFHEGRFHMIARYSSNPALAAAGRGAYATDQGVIGQVWLEEFAVARMPKDPDKWIDNAVRRYGFTPQEAANVSMKARKLGGFTIRSAEKCVGIVMLESLELESLSERVLEECREHVHNTPLPEIVEKSASLFPAVETFESTSSRRERKSTIPDDAWIELQTT